MTTIKTESDLQEECRKVVDREVYCCVSTEYEYILSKIEDKKAPATIDDIENLYDDEEREYKEIYEYWKVSNWLLNQLQERGEPVIMDVNVWGRCTTGQAIYIDQVIRDIVEELHA